MSPSVLIGCLLSVVTLIICQSRTILAAVSEDSSISDVDFQFTKPIYNVSIPENSVAKTYAAPPPGEGRMGIRLPASNLFKFMRYKIVGGDRDKFFKAEHHIVGDFCFLHIRTRTGNNDVLNRERHDRYELQVRAFGHKTSFAVHADAQVSVTVLDTNDLNPIFYPKEYNASVSEDTPVHQSILKVVAEDADLGRNGEIYYSFAEDTDQFAIHPVTGIISLSQPLRYDEGAYHDLTVLAQDRGVVFRYVSNKINCHNSLMNKLLLR